MADVVLADDHREDAQGRRRTPGPSSPAIRTGRAAPALVEKITVDYYGAEVPLQQLAGFPVPEARQLLITPYDKGAMRRHREGDPAVRPRPQPEQRRACRSA